MQNTTAHIEVFFTDPKNGWVAAEYDDEGNILDGARYSFRKSSAVRDSRAMAGRIYPIKVFGKNGELQRTLNSACIQTKEPT